MKEVYKDDYITVSETGHDYDFIAVIENNSNELVRFEQYGEDYFDIEPNDYIGLLADHQGRHILQAIKEKIFWVHYGEQNVSYEIDLEEEEL